MGQTESGAACQAHPILVAPGSGIVFMSDFPLKLVFEYFSVLAYLVLSLLHVFPIFSRNAKISISSYDILSCEILILVFLEKVGNTCLTRTRRDIIILKVNFDK